MFMRWALFMACVLAASAAAQVHPATPETEVVATVGPRTILARDVLERIELMPWPGKDRPALRDSVALQATLSLVAEKLLALQATAMGIGLDETISARFASLERALARDELFRQEINGRVSLPDDEAVLAVRRFGIQLRLAVFAVRNEQDARLLASVLTEPTDPPVARARRAAIVRQDTVTISFGELAPAHEDVAYGLSRHLEARPSFTRSSGWLVLQLLGRRANPAAGKLSSTDRTRAAENLLRKRKQADLTAAYYDRFAGGMPTRMDSVLFHAVADSLLALMHTDVEAHRKGRAFGVLEGDVHQLSRMFRGLRHRPFVTHGSDTVMLGQIIEGMVFHPIQVRSLGARIFMEDFNRATIVVAESEMISGRALQQHFNDHPDVRRDLSTWMEAWQTQELVRKHLEAEAARSLGAAGGPGPRQPPDTVSQRDALNSLIGELATRFGVAIDFTKVQQLDFTPFNIVTRRMIGFGGTLPAVPLLPHLWEWYNLWNREPRVQP